jgi:hypothetical protein
MHLDHSISLWISNQAREMGERECAQLKRMSRCSKYPREFPWNWPPRIYKTLKQIESLGSYCSVSRGDRMRRWNQPDVAPASGCYSPSVPMPATRPCSNIERRFPRVTSQSRSRSTDWPDAQMLMTGRWSTRRLVISKEVFSHSNSDRTCPLGRDRTHPSVRSTQTLATRWCHLDRTLTQCVRSPASAATQPCTGRVGVPRLAFARSARAHLNLNWPDTHTPEASVRSLLVTCFASVSSPTTLCITTYLFLSKALANVPTILCITMCTRVSIFSQTYSRVMLALH